MADPSLSSYPTAVDNFDRISDLDKDSTMIKAVQYKSYINSGNYTAAENYLKNNPDLKQCAISAEIVNKHSDAIVAIENDIKDNVKSNINTLTQNQNNIKTKAHGKGTLQCAFWCARKDSPSRAFGVGKLCRAGKQKTQRKTQQLQNLS